MRLKRGFTLVELMVVVAVLPIIVAAAGLFYLEGRVAAARVEARVQLNRNLHLALETIARDLRSSTHIQAKAQKNGGTAKFQSDGVSIKYEVLPEGLFRTEGTQARRLITRFITALGVEEEQQGFKVHLAASQPLIAGRRVEMQREAFIARRM